MVNSFLIPLIVAAGVSALVTGVVVRFARRLQIIDNPKAQRQAKNVVHDRPVPRGGGLPIFVALLVGVMIFIPGSGRIWAVVIGAAVLAVTGFIDDRFQEKVSPYARLGINILAALIVVASGVGIAYINNPFGGAIRLDQPQYCINLAGDSHCLWLLADVFALLWLVGMQNIVGWSSGVDGQLPGFVAIAAITMALLGLRFGLDPSQTPVIILGAITAGAYLGFLPWNWYPQKIMPGYGGKSLAGFLLGVLAILSVAKVGALVMVLGLPLVDGTLVVIKRLREGRSPVWGGYEHFHHYLLDRGWGRRRIAAFYWGVSAVLSIMALNLKAGSKYFTMVAVLLVFGGIIWWLHQFSTLSKQPDRANGSKT
ncbi:MAG: MraY family glycosyltransferase [bacterium]|nr:MraY family glycosyltransferase [bacterium]